MTRKLLLLVTLVLCAWLLAAGPAFWFGGKAEVFVSGAAAVLCLLPAGITLGMQTWAGKHGQLGLLLGTLAGTAVRLVAVLACALLLYGNVDRLHSDSFLIWVVLFYLVTLTVETVQLLEGHRKQSTSS